MEETSCLVDCQKPVRFSIASSHKYCVLRNTGFQDLLTRAYFDYVQVTQFSHQVNQSVLGWHLHVDRKVTGLFRRERQFQVLLELIHSLFINTHHYYNTCGYYPISVMCNLGDSFCFFSTKQNKSDLWVLLWTKAWPNVQQWPSKICYFYS